MFINSSSHPERTLMKIFFKWTAKLKAGQEESSIHPREAKDDSQGKLSEPARGRQKKLRQTFHLSEILFLVALYGRYFLFCRAVVFICWSEVFFICSLGIFHLFFGYFLSVFRMFLSFLQIFFFLPVYSPGSPRNFTIASCCKGVSARCPL